MGMARAVSAHGSVEKDIQATAHSTRVSQGRGEPRRLPGGGALGLALRQWVEVRQRGAFEEGIIPCKAAEEDLRISRLVANSVKGEGGLGVSVGVRS